MEDIYNLDLHEMTVVSDGVAVIRVAGGWLYMISDEQLGGHFQSSIQFVPFHNEFMGGK